MIMLAVVMGGCHDAPKSPIEARFERYIATENIVNEFIGVDSIILLDSVNLFAHYDNLVQYNDSIKTALFAEMKELNSKEMYKVRSQKDAIEHLGFISKLSTVTNKEVEAPIKEKISIFLENIPEAKGYYSVYKIVANFKEGKRSFYAHNYVYEDTITISSDRFGGQTLKFERMSDYFIDYSVNVTAPMSVLLSDVKAFREKFN